jgi:hypothetical protein
MAAVSAVLIPANPEQPVQRISVDGLDDLQAAVGGSIEAVDTAVLGERLTTYINADGKYNGCEANPRATTLLGPGLFAGDFIAGPLLVCGFDPALGENRDCPTGFESEFLGVPRPLPAIDAVRRSERRVTYEWQLHTTPEGKRHLAVLQVGHHTPGVSILTGRAHGNEFHATLRNETEENHGNGVTRGYTLGSGVVLLREQVPRFTRKGLETFSALAFARLEGLYGESDPRVTRYFATTLGASLGAVL